MADRASSVSLLLLRLRGLVAAGWSESAHALAAVLGAWKPPIRRREFWAVQVLVLAIAVGHAIAEISHVDVGPVAFVPISLFFIPIVYAAVNFGLHGSAPTAVLCAVVSVPNFLFWNSGEERLGEAWQILTVVAIGCFVGNRVDRETSARRQAEDRERAHRASEEKYRGLFDHVAEAILLLDPAGRVEEANEAAGRLLESAALKLVGQPVGRLFGGRLAAMMLGEAPGREARLEGHGRPLWIEPIATAVTDPAGNPRIQVVLRDVTRRYERELELEDYTRMTLAAREEERRRIARDLHDGPVQSLVLLVRELDQVGQSVSRSGKASLAQARDLAEGVGGELRRFSRELRPSVLDDLGLAAALKAEAEAFARQSDLAVETSTTGRVRRLDPALEVMFLRIEQEALHNVARHAMATKARVRLSFRNGSVRMAVEDDGRGLETLPPPSELLAASKMGIVGMQERARLAGAFLRLGRSRLGGTLVEVVSRP